MPCIWKFQAKIYFIFLSESFPGLCSNFPVHWQEIELLNSKKITVFSSDYDCFYPPFETWRTSKIIFASASSLHNLWCWVPHSSKWLAWSRGMCPYSRERCHIIYPYITCFPVLGKTRNWRNLTKNWRSYSFNFSPLPSLATSIHNPMIVCLCWMHHCISHQIQCLC